MGSNALSIPVLQALSLTIKILKWQRVLTLLKNSYFSLCFTKARAEQLVLESHRPREFQTLAIRPHLVWGKEDPHLLPKVITRHRQRLRIMGVGKNKMDLTHVSNVAHAHICAYRSKRS